MSNYKDLNVKLDEYLRNYNHFLYITNIEVLLNLLTVAKEKLIDPFEQNSQKISLNFEQKVDGITTISLVREFLETIDPTYTEKFDEGFRNGSFAFCDIINETPQIKINISGKENNHFFYNVGFEGNINDGRVTIHEFFHNLNEGPIDKSEPLAREFLTEMVSIYMEDKYLDFLIEKDYNKNDINNVKLERYITTYKVINRLYYETLALNIKIKLGYLDEETYPLIKAYKDKLYSPDVAYEEYISLLDNFDSLIKKENFNPHISCEYFTGTIFASYLLEEGDNSTIFKVAYLSDQLKEPMDFVEGLYNVGLSLNETEEETLIDITNKKYKKIIDNYIAKNKQEHTKR